MKVEILSFRMLKGILSINRSKIYKEKYILHFLWHRDDHSMFQVIVILKTDHVLSVIIRVSINNQML